MKKVEKLIKKFKAAYELNKGKLEADERYESGKIELDNLTWARLVIEPSHDGLGGYEVWVENEYGTQFEVSELSDMEISIFMTEIKC